MNHCGHNYRSEYLAGMDVLLVGKATCSRRFRFRCSSARSVYPIGSVALPPPQDESGRACSEFVELGIGKRVCFDLGIARQIAGAPLRIAQIVEE